MYSFPYLKPVHCSRSGSNCCFLTCIQVLQEAGKVIWYSHLFKNFPVCCDPHSQRLQRGQWSISFFWNSLAYSMIQWMSAIWSQQLNDVNGLNFPIKKQRYAEWIKTVDPISLIYKSLTWDPKTETGGKWKNIKRYYIRTVIRREQGWPHKRQTKQTKLRKS